MDDANKRFAYRLGQLAKAKEKGHVSIIRQRHDMGINARRLDGYMRGELSPDLQDLIAIADYYGASVDWLVGRTG